MARMALIVVAAALVLVSGCAAQNNLTRASSGLGSAEATAQSQQITVAADGGCASFTYNPDKTPGYNYSAALGVPTTLPGDCKLEDLTISKQYVQGACPDTRANNYAVSSLNIVNKCTDEVMVANTDTCDNVINKAPDGALATKGIGQGDLIDTGKTCWDPPTTFFFVKNSCNTAIPVTIKVYFDTYTGDCVNSADTDDGGDDVGGASPASSSSSGSGLSSGAKAGIAIGVIAGVLLIAAAVWFLCCQLRK